jgi:hypothetical protein
MNALRPLPADFGSTRDTLQHLAAHIVARARSQDTGEISLRVTPGGFGTPTFGELRTQVRISGTVLVRETDAPDAAAAQTIEMHGSTLAELAAVARVDLAADLDVGHDTPRLGDTDAPLVVDRDAAAALAAWYSVGAIALDRVVGTLPASATPTLVRLWPEHFDVAIDAAAVADRRVNLGASPGDGFHDEPYAYVGPWTDDRPGDPDFWNAPFGAVLGHADVVDSDDPVTRLTDFFLEGMRRLAD